MKGFGLFPIIIAVVVILAVGIGGGFYWNEIHKQKSISKIESFEDCVKAGYPVAGGVIPSFCVAPDGRRFTEKMDEGNKACSSEAKLCPNGSYVSRTGPNCEFAPCLGEVDTSNWKIYRNEKYGFEMKYPSWWNFDEYNVAPRPRFLFELEKDGKIVILPNGGWGWGPPLNEPKIYSTKISRNNAEVTEWSYFSISDKKFPVLQIVRLKELNRSWTTDNRIDVSIRSVEAEKTIYQILSTFKFIK